MKKSKSELKKMRCELLLLCPIDIRFELAKSMLMTRKQTSKKFPNTYTHLGPRRLDAFLDRFAQRGDMSVHGVVDNGNLGHFLARFWV
jgi:hypothetical protein